MDVPAHLLNPPAGGWPIRLAGELWLWLAYGIPPTAAETSATKMLRIQALREIRAIATPAPAGALPPPPTIRRRTSTWLPSNDYPPPRRQAVPSAPPANWVTQAALEGLAARHGVSYGQPLPPAAAAPVVALEQAPGGDERQVAPGGRPSTNAAAYDFIAALVAAGMKPTAAYHQAAIKFPSRGVDTVDRAGALGAGYRQRNRNNRE